MVATYLSELVLIASQLTVDRSNENEKKLNFFSANKSSPPDTFLAASADPGGK